jgi:4-phospho-D-threonate 3-dehydrogenase / 4-phospho-D-erythronate 3-dehydrogenase
MQDKYKPLLGITMGDPAGIGPEIVAKTLADPLIHALCRPLVVGDVSVMEQAIRVAGTSMRIRAVRSAADASPSIDQMDVYDLGNVDLTRLPIGQVSALAGHAAFEAVVKVIRLAMDGEIDATVTAPIHKESLNLAGHSFAGHTEIYAHYTGSRDVAMMLVSGPLRVVHVTTHVSLRQACDLIRKERVLRVIRMFEEALRQLGISRPRIAVAGLNPHAGDGGLFGDEEIREIGPAVEEAIRDGIAAEGPLPPDTIFSFLQGGYYDGCVAMYHDQGHIAFKMAEFEWDNRNKVMKSVRGINVTLGLPIVRVSVDHGTAFPIAGKGVACYESMVQAVEYAVALARKRVG